MRLERRLEFSGYEETSAFLDRAAELSEATGIFPNLSFGRTYVNLTLFAEEASGELDAQHIGFAEQLDALVDAHHHEDKE